MWSTVFDKDTKNTKWGKDSLFDKWCWKNQMSTCKRMKLEPYLTPHMKINCKYIKALNIRPETLKYPEENIRKKLLDIGLDNDFLHLTTQTTKAKINKQNYIKLNSFCTAKETINKMEKTTHRMGKTTW